MVFFAHHLPAILVLLPVVGAVAVSAIRNDEFSRRVAVGVVTGVLVVALLLLPPLSLARINPLALPLVLLVAFVFVPACLTSWNQQLRPPRYFALLLLLEAGVLGALVTDDLRLFLGFFTFSLLPIYLLMRGWGGPGSVHAGQRFLFIGLLGCIPLLIVTLVIHHQTGSFDFIALPAILHAKPLTGRASGGTGRILFALLMLTFLTRLAMVPLHRWTIDAHAHLPAAASMLLPSIQTVLGGYGILQVTYRFFPEAARQAWLFLAALGVITMLYGSLCALAQSSLKRLIAYAFISQTGLILLGAAVMTRSGMNGAIFAMISDGVAFAMLFFLAGVIQDRTQHLELPRLGGLASGAPILFGFTLVAFFAAMGLPPLCGFVGDFLVIMGTFQAARPDSILKRGGYAHAGQVYALAILCCVGGILTACVLLKALHQAFFGPVHREDGDVSDLSGREIAVLGSLAAMAFVLGILPSATVLPLIQPAVDHLHDFQDGSPGQRFFGSGV